MCWLIIVDVMVYSIMINGGSSRDVVAYLRRSGGSLVNILSHED